MHQSFGNNMKWIFTVIIAFISGIAAEPAIQEVGNRPTSTKPGRFLSLPIPQKCSQRPKAFFFGGNYYFYSGHVSHLANKKFDWLDSRNICREYCMDLVSLETQEENNLIFRLIQENNVPYIWTSGRLCDFNGCENRPDLVPKSYHGWFWSATRGRIPDTRFVPDKFSYIPWSTSGHKKVRQPDNAEHDINGTNESCLSILNNVYNDNITWHDVACYHEKPFVCEDNEELLNYVARTNPGIPL